MSRILHHENEVCPPYRWHAAPPLLTQLQTDMARALSEQDGARKEHIDDVFERARTALGGFTQYREAAYRRRMLRPAVIWRRGSSSLLDFGGTGPPLILVPSLVNASVILDLLPQESCVRQSAASGYRAFVIDWGEPGQDERQFRIGDYVTNRLFPAVDAALQITGASKVSLIGYCMGGVMALLAGSLGPDRVARIATLASPWDFSAALGPALTQSSDTVEALLGTYGAMMGVVPPQVTQSFFSMRDPSASLRKFKRLGEDTLDAQAARRFVAVEDWLNSGPPLTVPAAQECFVDWYRDNGLAKGTWRGAEAAFRAEDVSVPVLVTIGERDSVIPEKGAALLAETLPNARLETFNTGHLGLVVGSLARHQVWPRILKFLAMRQ